MATLCWCRYSMGSSTVMMWHARSVLMTLIIAARLVDFPDPVGPGTTTSPRGRPAVRWRSLASRSSTCDSRSMIPTTGDSPSHSCTTRSFQARLHNYIGTSGHDPWHFLDGGSARSHLLEAVLSKRGHAVRQGR